MKPKYQHQLFIEGLEHLECLNIEGHAVALDIETTGLDPALPTAQVTQVAIVPTAADAACMNEKAGLTEDVVSGLQVESTKEPGSVSKGSLHWVLRYNHYFDGLLETYGSRSGTSPSGYVRVEKTVTTCVTVGAPCNRSTESSSTVWRVPADSEIPLDSSSMERLLEHSRGLPSEAAVLCSTYDRLREGGLRYIIGQNVIEFDCTFLQSRWLRVPVDERGNRSRLILPDGVKCIDTMWIARVLMLPALTSLDKHGILSEEDVKVLRYLQSKGRPGRASSHLQDMRSAFSIRGGTAHDAAGDCRTNISVLRSIQAICSRYIGQLRACSEAQEEFRQLSFRASIGAD